MQLHKQLSMNYAQFTIQNGFHGTRENTVELKRPKECDPKFTRAGKLRQTGRARVPF